jgi:hypothetical protein
MYLFNFMLQGWIDRHQGINGKKRPPLVLVIEGSNISSGTLQASGMHKIRKKLLPVFIPLDNHLNFTVSKQFIADLYCFVKSPGFDKITHPGNFSLADKNRTDKPLVPGIHNSRNLVSIIGQSDHTAFTLNFLCGREYFPVNLFTHAYTSAVNLPGPHQKQVRDKLNQPHLHGKAEVPVPVQYD